MVAPSQSRPPLGLHIQPACLQHKYIRHANSSHIFERPERLRAVLLGFAGALARLEAVDAASAPTPEPEGDDLSSMLSSLSLGGSTSAFLPPSHVAIIPPPIPPATPGQILKHHPALQYTHSPPEEAPFPFLPKARGAALPSSTYMKELYTWASEAVETIRTTGCEFPQDKGLNAGDLYLGPGSVLAIEGCVQTVCQAVDGVCAVGAAHQDPQTPVQNMSSVPPRPSTPQGDPTPPPPAYNKAFCAIRPPGHHCGEDEPSGFCYVNNVVVGAMHAYLQHDVDRAIIIDFDLHHGNGTQALVMPLNAASYAEDLAMAAGKPPSDLRGLKGQRRGWKGFYGSVHDIYSYPCEDGDLDLIKDASLSLAAHGQYIENIHLQPYDSEEDFYERIYPMYTALLDKARLFMRDTEADPERTILFISAGFDACEHEHQGMQRHNRRVPVSFYSRYTRDIAAFADKYTGGKVVSVLEGGYGDRALTSAAMGHAIGLLDREGVPGWWSVEELDNLDRATKKKKRGGKLAALPLDLTSTPYLARAHALLAHFEGSPPSTPAPSVNATPQANANGRMTLRERRVRTYAEDTDVWSSSPRDTGRRRRGPATTANTPVATPKKPADDKSEDAYPSPASSPTAVPPPEPKLEAPPLQPKLEVPSEPVDFASPVSVVSDTSDTPKIILKIPRVTPPREGEEDRGTASETDRVLAPVPAAKPVAAQPVAPPPAPPKVAPAPQMARPVAPASSTAAQPAPPKAALTTPVSAPTVQPKTEPLSKPSNPAPPTSAHAPTVPTVVSQAALHAPKPQSAAPPSQRVPLAAAPPSAVFRAPPSAPSQHLPTLRPSNFVPVELPPPPMYPVSRPQFPPPPPPLGYAAPQIPPNSQAYYAHAQQYASSVPPIGAGWPVGGAPNTPNTVLSEPASYRAQHAPSQVIGTASADRAAYPLYPGLPGALLPGGSGGAGGAGDSVSATREGGHAGTHFGPQHSFPVPGPGNFPITSPAAATRPQHGPSGG